MTREDEPGSRLCRLIQGPGLVIQHDQRLRVCIACLTKDGTQGAASQTVSGSCPVAPADNADGSGADCRIIQEADARATDPGK